MSELSSCPPLERLRSFALGLVTEEEASAIADHIDRCSACERAVDSLDLSGDMVIGAILRPKVEDLYADELEYHQVEVLVQEIGREFTQEALRALASAEADHLISAMIGPYQLIEKIGSGGMGAVYKAVHRNLGKALALKVMRIPRTQDASAVARFEREMRAVGKLDHPHIVRATDAGECDGTHFLVMELIDGADFSTIAKQHCQLPVAEACEAIRQAALGLQEAHRYGLVHRDIKPSNLMLARSPRPEEAPVVKILDLGLARLTNDAVQEMTELTSINQVVGTIDYIAPEQLVNSHNVDIRADIYSLGATLYRLLMGEPPFPSSRYPSQWARLAALAHEDVAPVESIQPGLPEALARILRCLLSRDPAQRPATPDDVAEALQPFCKGHDLNRLWSGPIRLANNDATGRETSMMSSLEVSTDENLQKKSPIIPRHEALPAVSPVGPPKGSPPQRLLKSFAWWGGSGALLALCAVIVITIRRPDGTTVDMVVPSDSQIEISLREEGLPGANLVSDPPAAKNSPVEPNRIAVAWALSVGGEVSVIQGKQLRVLSKVDDLPVGENALEVDLSANLKVNDEGLKNLRDARAITILRLDGTKITQLRPLETLSQLETLWLPGNNFDDLDYKLLADMPNLRTLHFGRSMSANPGTTDAALGAISELTQITGLHIGGFDSPLTDAGVQRLRRMPQLEELTLSAPAISENCFMILKDLRKLKSLSIEYAPITHAGLAQFAQCQELTALELIMPEATDETLAGLPPLPKLEVLHLIYWRQLSGSGMAVLTGMPRLKRISVVRSGLTDDGLRAMCVNRPDLTYISLQSNIHLTNVGLTCLKEMPSLQTLNLVSCLQITDDAVPSLVGITHLKDIFVNRTGLTATGIEKLRTLRPELNVVE